MINEELKYIIFNFDEVDKINFNEVLETSIDTLRLSGDGLRTFVKWIGDEPECILTLTSKSVIYNHNQMIEILSEPEWVGSPLDTYTNEQ
jgi:hypothetical protein